MEQPSPRPALIVGNLAEYLGISARKTNGSPVGILTFRPHSTFPLPFNMMISRGQLERLREDTDFLLQYSAVLKTEIRSKSLGPKSRRSTIASAEPFVTRLSVRHDYFPDSTVLYVLEIGVF